MALSEITQRSPGFLCQGSLGEFIDRYFVAETVARKLSLYYQEDDNKTKSDRLQVQQLRAALSHFSIVFSEQDVQALFAGGDGKRNTKSARQLRNGYVHSLSSGDRKEIEEKSVKLNPLLAEFIAAICYRSSSALQGALRDEAAQRP